MHGRAGFRSPPTRRRFVAAGGALAAGALLPGRGRSRPASPAIRWPAEDEPHQACLMSWPHRRGFYLHTLDRMQDEIAATARTIAGFEPVLLVAHPGHGAEARARCGPTVNVIELPLDDCWMRDNGPIFVQARTGGGWRRVGLDFGFNAWGNPNWAFANDDALPRRLCARYGEPCRTVPFVLEGGAVLGDGQGTVYTTEECLLDPSRNGPVSRGQVEAALARTLGARKVVWLPWGLAPGDLTEGHVDGVLALVRPGTVLLQAARPTDSAEVRRRAAENLAALQGQADAMGRPIQVIPWPWMTDATVFGATFLHTYLNFYLPNGAVVVPLAGSPDDAPALADLRALFPRRTVAGVDARALGYNGGGVHCVTQQVPA